MKTKSNNLVFVVENDHFHEERIKDNFKQDHDHVFIYFKSSSACIQQLDRHPMAVLVDYDLKSLNTKERDAIKILEKIKELDHHTQVVFFSSLDSKSVAEDVIQHGAYDYVVVNDNSFLRLQKTLSNIHQYLEHKKSAASFRLWTWISLVLYTVLVIIIMLLYYKGYMHDKGGDLVAP